MFRPQPSVDYYDNLCDIISTTTKKTTKNRREQNALLTINDPEPEAIEKLAQVEDAEEEHKKKQKPIFDQKINQNRKSLFLLIKQKILGEFEPESNKIQDA